MRKTFILIFSIALLQAHGQSCETFERDLFHVLPEQFPDTINCVDSIGRKQGWWLNYKVKYNPVDRPDELAKGDYVERYSYGQFKNNRKVGTWQTVENVHLIYESRVDSFFYSNDSTIHITYNSYSGFHKIETHFNSDSTIISYTHFLPQVKNPIEIECNKNLTSENQCHLTFGEHEKVFPFERRFIEV